MRSISRRARPHTITLYNYVDTTGGVATYQRTVLAQVHLDPTYKQRLNLRGIQTDDEALLLVDLTDFSATSNRTFMAHANWKALTTQQKAASFTFGPNDFFVEGTATETLPNTTKAGMQSKYRCFAVTNVAVPVCGTTAPLLLEVTAQ